MWGPRSDIWMLLLCEESSTTAAQQQQLWLCSDAGICNSIEKQCSYGHESTCNYAHKAITGWTELNKAELIQIKVHHFHSLFVRGMTKIVTVWTGCYAGIRLLWAAREWKYTGVTWMCVSFVQIEGIRYTSTSKWCHIEPITMWRKYMHVCTYKTCFSRSIIPF